jgi:2-dehydropantoate 2-reductase
LRICIYGAGAIGGYLAAYLARSGAAVSVIARGAHLAAIRDQGLTLELPEERFTTRPHATDDPASLGVQDAVIVTVKAPSLPSVAAGIGPLLGPETAVVFLTNGIPWWYFMGHGGADDGRRLPLLDPGDALWQAVGPRRLIGGIAWPASALPSPGVVRMISAPTRGCEIGTPDGRDTPALTALAEAFVAAGLALTVNPQIRQEIWRKLAFNLSAGPLCVLTTAPVRVTQEEPSLVAASRALIAEAQALIHAMGFDDLNIDPEPIVAMNARLPHRPSILQDLLAGRAMEIDALYSVPLEMARDAGVAMPVLERLTALIKVRARAAGLYG